MKNTALKTAGIIFLVIAVVHVVRLILKLQVTVAGSNIPHWASLVASIVSISLSLWMFSAARK